MLEGYFPDNNILRFNLSKVRKNYKYKLQFLFISDKSKNYDGMKIFSVDLVEYLPNKILSLKDDNVFDKGENSLTKSLIINSNNTFNINDLNKLFNINYNSFDELEINAYNLLGEVIFSNNTNLDAENIYIDASDFSKFIGNIISGNSQKQIIFINFIPKSNINSIKYSEEINSLNNSKHNSNMYLKLLIE